MMALLKAGIQRISENGSAVGLVTIMIITIATITLRNANTLPATEFALISLMHANCERSVRGEGE